MNLKRRPLLPSLNFVVVFGWPNDLAQAILKDEPKKKIIVFSGRVAPWTAKMPEKKSV